MIYAIRVKGKPFVKIGWTNEPNIRRRMFNLQLACPFELEVMAVGNGNRPDEQAIHRKLKAAKLHHRGEWFKLEGETFKVIEQLPTLEPMVIPKLDWSNLIDFRKNETNELRPLMPLPSSRVRESKRTARLEQRKLWWRENGERIAAEQQ